MSLNAAGPKKGVPALGSSGVPISEYSRKEDPRPAYMQSRPTISGVPMSTPFSATDAAASGGAANNASNPNERKAAAANSASAAPVGAVGNGQTTQQQQSSSTPLLPATSSTLLQLGAFAVSDGRRVLTPSGLPYNHRHKFYYVKESNMAPLATSVVPPAILPAALLGGAGNINNAAQSNGQQIQQARRASAAVGGATPLMGIAPPMSPTATGEGGGGMSSAPSVPTTAKSDAAVSLPFRAQTPNLRLSSSSSSLPISHQVTCAAAVPVRPNSASVGMVMPAGPAAPYAPLANPHQSVLASGLVYESVLRPLTSGGGAVDAGTGANSRCGSSTPPAAFSFFHNTTTMAADSSDILSGSSSPYKGGQRNVCTPGKPPRPTSSSLSPLHPHHLGAYGGGGNSPLSSTLTSQKGHTALPSLVGNNGLQSKSNSRPPSSTSRIRACGLPRGPVEVEQQQDANQQFSASYTQKKGSADDYAELLCRTPPPLPLPYSTGSSPASIGGNSKKRSGTPSGYPQPPTVAVVESASAHAVLSGEDILSALESDAGSYAATLLTDLHPIPSEARLRPSRSEVAAYLEAMATWWGASQSPEDDGRAKLGGKEGREVDLLSDAYRLRLEARTEAEMSSAGGDPVGLSGLLRERQQRVTTAAAVPSPTPAGSDNPYLDFADQPLSSVSLSVVGVDLETVFGRSYAAQRCLEEQLMLEARIKASSNGALTATTPSAAASKISNNKKNKNIVKDHAAVSGRRGRGGGGGDEDGMAGIARDDEADDMFPLPPPSSKGGVVNGGGAPVSLGRQHRLTAEKQHEGREQEEKTTTSGGGAALAPTRTPSPTTMANNSRASLSPTSSQPTTARPSDIINSSNPLSTTERMGGEGHGESSNTTTTTTRQRNGIAEIASLIRAAMVLKEKVEEIDGGEASTIVDERRGGTKNNTKKIMGSRNPYGSSAAHDPDATNTPASVFLSTLSKALTPSHQRLFGHHVSLNVNVADHDKKSTRSSMAVAAGGELGGRSPTPSPPPSLSAASTDILSTPHNTVLCAAAPTIKCPYSIKTCVDTDSFALQLRVVSELGVVIGCHLFILPLTEKAESTGEPLSVASLTSKLAGMINGAVAGAIDDEEYIMAMNEYIAATTGLVDDEKTNIYGSYSSGTSKIPQKSQNIAIGVVEIPTPHGQQQQQQRERQDDLKKKSALSPSRTGGVGGGATKLFTLPQPLQDPSSTAANTRRNHAALCLMTNSVSSSSSAYTTANSANNHKHLPTHEGFLTRVSEPNMNNSQLLKKLTSVAFVVSVDVHLVLPESEAASSFSSSTNNTVDTLGPVEGTIMTNAGLTVLARLNLTREAVQKACRTTTPRDTFDRLELADEGDGSLIAKSTSTKRRAKKSTSTGKKSHGNGSTLDDENAAAAGKEQEHGDSAQKTPVPTVVIESRLSSSLVRSHAPLIGSSALSRAVLVLAAIAQQEYDAAFGTHLQGLDDELLSTYANSLRRLSSYAFGANGAPGAGLTGGTQIKNINSSTAFDAEAARSHDVSASGNRSFNTVSRSGELIASTAMTSGGGIECIVRSPVPRDGLRTALQQAAAGIAARDEELTEAYILSQGGADSLLNPTSGADPSSVPTLPPTAGKGTGKQQGQQRAGPGAQSTIGTAAKRMSLAASMMTGPNNNGLGGSRGGASTAGAGSESGVGGGLGVGSNGGVGEVSSLLLLAVGQGKIPDAVGVSNVVTAIDAAAVVATPAKRKSVSPASKQQGGGKRQSSTDLTAAGIAAATAGGPNGVIAGVPNNILLAPDGQVLVATVPIDVANYRDQQRIRHATDMALLQRREELIAAGIIQTVVEEPAMPTKPGRRGSRAPSTAGASGGPNANARGGGGRSASPSSSFLPRGDGYGNGDQPAGSPSAAERSRILSSGSSALVAKLYAQQLKSGGATPSSDVLALSSAVSSPASNALNDNMNKATDSEFSVSFWMTRSDVSEIQADALRSSAGARSWEATTIELALPDPLLLPIAIAAAYQDRSRVTAAAMMMNSQQQEGSSKSKNTNVLQPVMHYCLRAEDGGDFVDTPFPRPADVFALSNNSLDVFLRARLMPSGTKTRQTNKAALHQALFATRSTARALIAFAGAPLKWSSDEAAQFVAAEYREEKGDTNSPLQGRGHSRRAGTPSKMSQREQNTNGLSPSPSSSLSAFSSPLVKKAVTYAPCSHTSLVSAARIYLNDLFQLHHHPSENCSSCRSSSPSLSANRHPLLSVADVMFTYGGTYRPQGGDSRTLFATATESPLETSVQLQSQQKDASVASMFVAPASQEPEPLITHIIETVPRKQTRASVSLQVRATAPPTQGSSVTGLIIHTHNGSTIAGGGVGVDTAELIKADTTSTKQRDSQEAVSLQPFAMSSSDARGGRFVRATFVAHPSENISVFAAEVSAMANDLVRTLMY